MAVCNMHFCLPKLKWMIGEDVDVQIGQGRQQVSKRDGGVHEEMTGQMAFNVHRYMRFMTSDADVTKGSIISLDSSLCRCCFCHIGAVEDEQHFLFDCSCYSILEVSNFHVLVVPHRQRTSVSLLSSIQVN